MLEGMWLPQLHPSGKKHITCRGNDTAVPSLFSVLEKCKSSSWLFYLITRFTSVVNMLLRALYLSFFPKTEKCT